MSFDGVIFKMPYFGNYFAYRIMCNFITPLVTISFACILFYNNHLGTPLNCRNPGFPEGNWTNVATTQCWTKFNLHSDIEGKKLLSDAFKNTTEAMNISTVVFGLAGIVWIYFELSGVSLARQFCIKTMLILLNPEEHDEEEEVDNMVQKLRNISVLPVIHNRSRMFVCSLAAKLAYAGSIMYQSSALSTIIGEKRTPIWGFKILSSRFLSIPTNFTTSNFPHKAYCSISEGDRAYTFPCSIPFNEMNELLFALYSIWIFTLTILVTYDFAEFIKTCASMDYIKSLMKEIYGKTITMDMAQQLQCHLGFDIFVIIKSVFDISESIGEKLMRKMLETELVERDEEVEDLLNGNREIHAEANAVLGMV
ncbi:unnamed protein product [Caenorhabditis bovis]|uniref:Innexin n=1 Tax=Caenorhabditis bovis TaxID=2654633 RepID=A0A8S1ED80_9PELO|nr:unnamed protein product [Caenorhabditis bovis]